MSQNIKIGSVINSIKRIVRKKIINNIFKIKPDSKRKYIEIQLIYRSKPADRLLKKIRKTNLISEFVKEIIRNPEYRRKLTEYLRNEKFYCQKRTVTQILKNISPYNINDYRFLTKFLTSIITQSINEQFFREFY